MARLMSGQNSVIKAVDNITLNIHKGETLGLVGESGCGKSTLSRTILQLVRPTAGQVTFDQTDLAQLRPNQLQQCRRQIQMIFQDPRACLNPMMTVGQSIADPLLIHNLATPKTAPGQGAFDVGAGGPNANCRLLQSLPRRSVGGANNNG